MRTFCLEEFAIPADYKVKIQEGKKRNKHLDHPRKLKKLWNIRVTMIIVIVGVLGMVPKGLERRLKKLKNTGRTIHTTALLRSARILSKVLET